MGNLNKICKKFSYEITAVLAISLILATPFIVSASTSVEECMTVPTVEPPVVSQSFPDPREKLTQYITSNYRVTAPEAKHIVETVYSYSAGIDFPPPHLVFAVIAVESSFRPTVVSHKGARGLMQVMPINEPGVTIEDNILAGIWVLQKYRARVATDEAALQAYNVGITAYKKGRRSTKYLSKVQKEKKRFEVLTFNTF